jgi:hypothetical protein
MTETITPEEFKKQFGRAGYLADVMKPYADRIRAVSADWFKLANDTNESLGMIAVKAMETHRGLIGDKRILSTLLLLRALGMLQASILLLERGMVVEARVLMRSLLETGFCVAAILKDADGFVKQFSEDSNAAQKAQANLAIKYGKIESGSETYKSMMDLLDRFTAKQRFMRIDDMAQTGPMAHSYLLYRIMSNDSAHTSLSSALHHFDFDVGGDREGGFSYGPHGSDKVAANLDNLVVIATGIGVGFTNIVADADGNRAVAALCDRYAAMSGNIKLGPLTR